MKSLFQHEWGVSRAQDRIWSHVVGLRTSRAAGRLIMALNFQAYIDESQSEETGEFVLAGHIAPAGAWAQFSKDWEEMLPYGILGDDNNYYFKMSEMALSDERLRAFYKIIEKYVSLSISCRINIEEFNRAKRRVSDDLLRNMHVTVDFSFLTPYYLCLRQLIDDFHDKKNEFQSVISLDEKIDFIFDNRSEKSIVISAWDEAVKSISDELRWRFGSVPRFEDDMEFLPLQAADLWAWWMREWYELENSPYPERMKQLDFGSWCGEKRLLWSTYVNEDNITEKLLESLSNAILIRKLCQND